MLDRMAQLRKVDQVLPARETMEGAGVRLKRAFGNAQVPLFDPYLLLDDFRSDDPDDYIAGFPWHPHRGIETVTYLLQGQARHEDSLGNNGVLGPGDVQWMSAASGIVHQEMPEQKEGLLHGFQLWVNLPAAHKMDAPRYQEITAAKIPTVKLENGGTARLVAGELQGTKGPVVDILCEPFYAEMKLMSGEEFQLPLAQGHTAFAYLFEGTASFKGQQGAETEAGHVILFKTEGDRLSIQAGEKGARFLLITGKPIGEPVAWYGPMVMNTRAELETAFREYQQGTFIRD